MQVTIVSGYEESKPIKGLTDVVFENGRNVEEFVTDIFAEGRKELMFHDLLYKMPEMCLSNLADKGVQELKKEKFDIVMLSMFFSTCFSSLLHHFKVIKAML